MRLSHLALVLLSIVLIVVTGLVAAQDENSQSRIAFLTWRDMNPEVYVMNADGSDAVNVTNNPLIDNLLGWTADGTQLIVRSVREDHEDEGRPYIVNADGSGLTALDLPVDAARVRDVVPSPVNDDVLIVVAGDNIGSTGLSLVRDGAVLELTDADGFDNHPSWSPDGAQIVFQSGRDGNLEVYVMNADGSDVTNLTNLPNSQEGAPVWSPDGTQIAFNAVWDGNFEIAVMDADGQNKVNLTNHPAEDSSPAWSPDGSQIAFMTTRDDGNLEIYVMNADGSNPVNISNNEADDEFPVWMPAPSESSS
ncbi:MAG: hypothetical protein D6737_04680 [Chloroflexi bacterium]|nr:MAG: hypothetical protein D6737_04680 [Chloroflexota bacterium]